MTRTVWGIGIALSLCLPLAGSGWAEPPAQSVAERNARARWFDFELEPMVKKWKGDWAQVIAAKQAEDDKLAKQWKPADDPTEPHSPLAARAQRVLQAEFVEIAQQRKDEIRALAKRTLLALQKGDIESLVDDCTMYDAKAKDRRELTRAYLREHRRELQAAAMAADVNAADFAQELQFSAPDPSRGMTGQVTIPYGKKAKKPKNPELYPERHELELWWSGEVMPEANGPVHPAPVAGEKPAMRWRFYQVIKPYSMKPTYLL